MRIMKRKFIIIACLLLIFGLALFLRVYFCYEKVMTPPIKYAADDGIYHMRLVENMLLGKHFPHRLYFDAYTYFPYGTYINMAPLFTWLLAVPIWLIGLGKPSAELIHKIAPFIPAILGSLAILIAYFIAKALFNRKTGLLAALLMAISSPYLYKSLLGATDHHVVEPIFSGLAMLFLILALSTFGKQKLEGRAQNKRFWLYTILAGISLGLYFLTWPGAVIFVFIIFCFIVLYYLIEYQKLVETRFRQTLKMGMIIFLIPLLMMLPFVNHPDILRSPLYSFIHLGSLVLGVLGFLLLGWLGNFIKKKKWPAYLLPISLILLFILCALIIKFTLPNVFNYIMGILKAINQGIVSKPISREVISEMRPLTLLGAIRDFSLLFFLSLIALAILIYQFIKKTKPEYLLIIIWTLIMFLLVGIIPAIGQQRHSIYLSLNISILAAFVIIQGIKFGWQGIKIAHRNNYLLLVASIAIILIMVFVLLFPFPINILRPYPQNLPQIFQSTIQAATTGPASQEDDWYQTMDWLSKNTPEPELNYFELYPEPKQRISFDTVLLMVKPDQINPYPYPEDAYGILARWDVGHMITYYSHRLPNANPFQQGMGDKNGDEIVPGSSVFFTETDETKAIQYLDELKTRYVITDNFLADAHGGFLNLLKWLGEEQADSSQFEDSMIAQLHLQNGENLEHFRLIYESPQKEVKIFEYVNKKTIRNSF